jgi:hypothetical protein
MLISLTIALSLWYAWRSSRQIIDPDWAMFNLYAFTGAVYGRDFADCKMPTIHLWYAAIARVVGKDIGRVKFVHHCLIALPGILVGGWAGLAFVVWVNSGWLYGFHGNVGQIPAGLLLLTMTQGNAWVGAVLAFIAIAFEPKMVLSALLVLALRGWWLPMAAGIVASLALALAVRKLRPMWWGPPIVCTWRP